MTTDTAGAPKTYEPGIELVQAGACPAGSTNPIACRICPYGHATECHYPMACDEARCGHCAREAGRGKCGKDRRGG